SAPRILGRGLEARHRRRRTSIVSHARRHAHAHDLLADPVRGQRARTSDSYGASVGENWLFRERRFELVCSVPAAPLQTIRILPHISRALDAGAPIVALESSVLAQGLPVPQNGEAAQRMIAAIERVGAIAAITAVVCGTPALGLEPQELARFLRRDGVRKVSARDIAVAAAQRAD